MAATDSTCATQAEIAPRSSVDDDPKHLEVAYEHQRQQPMKGWGAGSHMLPTDRKGWTDRKGKPVPFHPETTDDKPAQAGSDDPGWVGGWQIDREHTACDEEGWVYAADFGPLMEHQHSDHPRLTDFVRRRRWVRTRRPCSVTFTHPPLPDSVTSGAEEASLFPRGAHEKGTHCWSEPDATTFKIRGPTYLDDKVKIKSAPGVFELAFVDLFASDTKVDNVAAVKGAFLDRQRQRGDTRFYIVVNFQAPPHHLVTYFALPVDAAASWDSSFKTVWDRFLHGDDKFRDSRWKVIPSVVEGPWMVKKSVGQKPALLGTKLTTTYHIGTHDIELDCDIYSSKTASVLVGMMKGYASAFAIDVAFCIQGNEPEELPERIIGGMRMSRPTLDKARQWSPEGAAPSKPE